MYIHIAPRFPAWTRAGGPPCATVAGTTRAGTNTLDRTIARTAPPTRASPAWAPSSQKLIPIPGFLPPGYSSVSRVFQCFLPPGEILKSGVGIAFWVPRHPVGLRPPGPGEREVLELVALPHALPHPGALGEGADRGEGPHPLLGGIITTKQ